MMAMETGPQDDIDVDSDLLRAAEPVVTRLADALGDTEIGIVVSDDRARVVVRRTPSTWLLYLLDSCALEPGSDWSLERAGTNAIGLVTHLQVPVVVADNTFAGLSAVSAPIADAHLHQLVGALTLVCPAASAGEVVLSQAKRAAEEVERRLRSRRTRRERRRGQRARARFGWTSLTEAERVIAAVIGDGLTNREAAKRLFVSRHTVDAHLRRIYQKLGINSRVELARMLASKSAQVTEF
jgi:DNA-binding CsgD family transcriptional regulator